MLRRSGESAASPCHTPWLGRRLRAGARVACLAVAFAVLAAGNAQAIAIYASDAHDGFSAGIGFDAAEIAAAKAAGVQQLPDSKFFSGTLPGNEIVATAVGAVSGNNVPAGSKTTPSIGTGGWAVTALDQPYLNLWIVIQGHDFPNDPLGPNGTGWYSSVNVGLDVDPTDPRWAIVNVDPSTTGGVEISYLAYNIGLLPQGPSITGAVPLAYRVAQGLAVTAVGPPTEYTFPMYRVAFLTPVPEPALGMLLAGAGLALAARRKCSA
jgi:hypothetical protein